MRIMLRALIAVVVLCVRGTSPDTGNVATRDYILATDPVLGVLAAVDSEGQGPL